MPRYLISNCLGLVGAVIGGVLGFYTFGWLRGQHFYGQLMIPGIFLGLGWPVCSPSIARPLGESSADWPRSDWGFIPNGSSGRSLRTDLSYFLKNVGSHKPVTLLMLGVGALIAFWIGGDSGYARLSTAGAYNKAGSEPWESPVTRSIIAKSTFCASQPLQFRRIELKLEISHPVPLDDQRSPSPWWHQPARPTAPRHSRPISHCGPGSSSKQRSFCSRGPNRAGLPRCSFGVNSVAVRFSPILSCPKASGPRSRRRWTPFESSRIGNIDAAAIDPRSRYPVR